MPQRNLLRQLTWSLPSGQNVARVIGVEKLTPHELRELKPYGFEKSTPLWYYVLREAELRADGLTLGKVGGRIVAEVLIGLLQTDTGSYLVQQPNWAPTPTAAGSSFRMSDFLTFAGVDPTTRRAVGPDRA